MNSTVSETLAKLRHQFIEQLPSRIDAIRMLYRKMIGGQADGSELQAIRFKLHDLTGLAGTFGMQSLSRVARDIERHFDNTPGPGVMQDAMWWQEIGEEFELLGEIMRSHVESAAPSLQPPPVSARLDRTPLVHIVEDDPMQAGILSKALAADGYRVESFTTADEFRSAITTENVEAPAVVVMDMVFPEGDDVGSELISSLGLGKESPIPVVVVSVREDMAARLAAFRAGACRYLVKPLDNDGLIDILDGLTGRQPTLPYRILLVDDEEIFLEAQAAILRAAGMEVFALSRPMQTLEVVENFKPDVIVLDVYMPEVSGPELAAILREQYVRLNLPILFLSSESNMTQQLMALNLGGDDFLVKPVQADHLVAAVLARARRSRQSSAIRHRLDSTLYEREREHLALNEHAIVSVADASGQITYVNDRFCQVSGYQREELLGHGYGLIRSDYHSGEYFQDMWQTISRGEIWQGEICNQRKDGRHYWVASTITPFLSTSGKPYQYVSIQTDISHVKQAEREIELQKERLSRGQSFANIGTWDWNIETGKVYWSERVPALFGYTSNEQESSYDDLLAVIHSEDRQMVINAMQACVERGEPYELEYRIVWPDGSVHWIHSRGNVQRDSNEKPLQMLGVIQDIDERKRAEDRLVLFQRIFDASAQCIGIADAQGHIIYINQAHEKLLGYRQDEIQGKNYFSLIPGNESKAYSREILKAFEQDDSWAGNLPLQRKDGSCFVSNSHIGFVTDDEGNIQNIFNLFTDFSGELARREELNVAKQTAERASEAKSDFLSSMSHELRTPLNAILGFAQIIEFDGNLPPEEADAVAEILKAGNHLLDLINEVLDLSKVESGRIDLSLEKVELLPIADECIGLLRSLANERDITIENKLENFVVSSNRIRLKQVLLNLISNAIKYNRKGGKVSLSAEHQAEGTVRIQVTDTGLGIPKERFGELFEPFRRLDAERGPIEGTGIGLTLAQRIVELMNGRLGVESELGIGSTFWLELPSNG